MKYNQSYSDLHVPKIFVQETMDMDNFHINKYIFFSLNCIYSFSPKHKLAPQVYLLAFFHGLNLFSSLSHSSSASCIHMVSNTLHASWCTLWCTLHQQLVQRLRQDINLSLSFSSSTSCIHMVSTTPHGFCINDNIQHQWLCRLVSQGRLLTSTSSGLHLQ